MSKKCCEKCEIIATILDLLENNSKHKKNLRFLEILNIIILLFLFLQLLPYQWSYANFFSQAKMKIENDFDNLKSEINIQILNYKIGKFNSDELLVAYNKSVEVCKNYPMEGTGSFYICQGEYFKKHQQKLSDKEYKIYKYCSEVAANYAIDSCMKDRIKLGNENFKTKINQLKQEEQWEKIKKNIYIDTKSIVNQNDFVTGTFKKYYTKDEHQEGKRIAYKTIWTGVYCDIKLQDELKKMEYPIYKYYDINKNFIYEDNIHEYWSKEYHDGHLGITHPEEVVNGKILFNSLCQYYKK